MMYMCQFGVRLVIGPKIECKRMLLIELYDPGDLEN